MAGRPAVGSAGQARLSLAGQLLVLQLGLVTCVLVLVALVSYAQSDAAFTRDQSRRVTGVAETLAASPALRSQLGPGGSAEVVATLAEGARGLSGADEVLVTDTARRVLASSDPDLTGTVLELGAAVSVLQGRGWVGAGRYAGGPAITAYVPVLDFDGDLIGVVGASSLRPSWFDVLRTDSPRLLAYLGAGVLLGGVGSLLLARRVKRQTLGLEPRAIASLVEHRDAMLEGVREGVLGLDDAGRVTLANDEARHLLDLPDDVVGRVLADLDLPRAVADVLLAEHSSPDSVVVDGERMLVVNRRPISSRGRSLGSVTTLRDRTELVALEHELDATRVATSTLRAQAHEFDNRLHVIAGLVELEEYDDVVRYVHAVRRDRAQLDAAVGGLVRDTAVAALLSAKSSLARERRVRLVIAPESSLDPVDDALTGDLVTVVGNLVDNAIDAAAGTERAEVVVSVVQDPGEVVVRVADSGAGVPEALRHSVFREGFSTKTVEGTRGFGLALTRLACTRRGGDVEVHGAQFVARLPLLAAGTRA